jgi:hypothetical protein
MVAPVVTGGAADRSSKVGQEGLKRIQRLQGVGVSNVIDRVHRQLTFAPVG